MDNAIISRKWSTFFSKVSFFLLCAVMADCCISGSGRMLMIGPISGRMILLGLTLLAAVPSVIEQHRTLLNNKILWVFATWLVWFFISTVIGFVKGNNISVIITDLKGYAYFALLPAAICILDSKKKVLTLMKVMMHASGLLGLLILIHFFLFVCDSKIFSVLYSWGIDCKFSAMSRVSDTIPRLFFYSTNYLLVGCSFATYFQVAQKKLSPGLCLLTGVNLIGLLMSYTRSVYLGVGVAIVALVVAFLFTVRKASTKRFLSHLGVSIVAFFLVLSIFGITMKTDYVSYAITRTLLSFDTPTVTQPTGPTVTNPTVTDPTVTGPTVTNPTVTDPTVTDPTVTDPTVTVPSTTTPPATTPPITPPDTQEHQQATIQSDQLRSRIQAELLRMIRKSPIIGNGTGATIEWRSSNEYFYLDLVAKSGFIGLVLYLSPLLAAIFLMLKRRKETASERFLCSSWICVLLGFMAFSFFNPYMNASLGVLFYCCTLAVVNIVMKKPTCEVQ